MPPLHLDDRVRAGERGRGSRGEVGDKEQREKMEGEERRYDMKEEVNGD